MTTWERLFGFQHAFDDPVTVVGTVAVVGVLVTTLVVIALLHVDPKLKRELWLRTLSWCVLVPLILGPVLLGAAWVILGVGVLSIFCYREYSRVTGLFREKTVSATVAIGIVLITFAVFDHWYGFFMALGPLGAAVIAAAAILKDEPKGYVQRVALGVLAFGLFGVGLGHLGYLANDADYRPILVLVLVSVELNDVFAFISGKLFGKRKLCPHTSPGKTIAGAIGSLVMTTLLVTVLGRFVFTDGVLHGWFHLALLGVIVSVAGQFGDLMLSSIKRDVGIKDTGRAIPGHGGLLDRFDSLLLVAPAVFHYVGYFRGVGLDQPVRIITGG